MKHTLRLNEIQLNEISSQFYIEVRLNRFKAKMIIDTGASQTVISEKFASKLKLEAKDFINDVSIGIADNQLSPKLADIKLLQIGDIKIRDFQCIILPMEHINEAYKSIGEAIIDGIIGSEILIFFNSLINFKNNTLTLFSKNQDISFSNFFH